MKQNAGSVYYFIKKSIESCDSLDQLKNCVVLIDNACFYNYAFAWELGNMELIKRCELIAETYPIYE
jgi:hypothetical protein